MKHLDNTFLSWLPRIRENPGIFLGEPSLTALSHFWDGYAFREMPQEQNVQEHTTSKVLSLSSGKHFMDGFEEFVYSHFDCEWSTRGWVKFITENCSSEAEAFYKFFELFDAFMSEKR